ncbi:ABC transporter substrate-binding protein [Massilia sp. NR 4-1]|uniref:ABC transporter substrate-binding protein n=1 Tax=Massilia sp. NR 4-1 TaxID=1678028 RepID=UPI00067DBFE9|nr:ABC transporter substrate-binding protein [Massilia sp. NR 4-1]
MALAALPGALAQVRPQRVYMILYRGETGVERGFRDYFTLNRIPVEFIIRNVDFDASKVPALIAEARELKVDLVYTYGTAVTMAVAGREGSADPARNITNIPIVFTMVAAPQACGIVKSLASSRRNVTGVSHVVPVRQQMNAIRAYRRFERIAALYNPAEPNAVVNMREWRALAAQEHFQLIEKPVPLDDQGKPLAEALPGIIEELAQQADLLYLGPDSFLMAHRKQLTEVALAQRLPTFSAVEAGLREGRALFGLVSGYENLGRLAAHKAVQILRHRVKPAALPIETLPRFSYLVNMSVAEELKLYPPAKVLQYAEQIR